MNPQEHIRRILREEDFIPLESLNLVIKDYEDGFDVYIMGEDKKIGEISFTKEDKPNQYTIVDATIDDEYKGNRIYPKTIIKLFKEKPNIIINSVFRSPDAEKAWKYLLSDLPSDIEKKIKHYKEENTTLYQLKLKNLQESIRKVLKEETELPIYFRRRIDMETLEQLYNFVLKIDSKRYTDKKKHFNAMTPYKFNQLVISNLIEDVCENFELECDDNENRFNQLWDFLSNKYSKQNIKHFNKIR